MTFPRTLLPMIVICAIVAWLAGPVGRFVVALPLVLFGPGYLLDRALGARFGGAFTRPALWLGLSMSLVALLYEWATTLGIALSAAALHGLALLCAAGVVLAGVRGSGIGDRGSGIGDRGSGIGDGNSKLKTQNFFSPAHLLILLLILTLTLWLRFVQIENLALPLWVDSVHHALMVRVAAETGLAPISLRPYLPIDQLTYHWGYHVVTAAVMQLSGVGLPQVLLWEGQVLNALQALAGAALAAYLWRRPSAGLAAAAVIGLVSIMPSYYVSWGRYTQLAGLLLLPPLAIVWRDGLYAGVRRWWLYAAVLLAGLSLIHFRVLIFALALLAVISVVWLVQRGWPSRAALRASAQSATLALLLGGPWLALLAARRLARIVAQPQSFASDSGYAALNTGILWADQNALLVALALLAALWGLRRRALVAAEQVGWVAGMFVLANPWLVAYVLPACGAALLVEALPRRRVALGIGGAALLLFNPWLVRLPSSWLITNDVVTITLFLPIAVLLGGGTVTLLDHLGNPDMLGDRGQGTGDRGQGTGLRTQNSKLKTQNLLRQLVALLLAAYALWSGWGLRGVVNEATVLATPADVAAIAWVAQHTPPDARFLINATGWLPAVDRGTDGGWWLLPLAGRWTSTPPVIADYGAPDYVRHMREVSSAVVRFQPGKEADLYALIAREQIGYIYLGAKPGPLTPATFADAARFPKVYEQDGVTILAVR